MTAKGIIIYLSVLFIYTGIIERNGRFFMKKNIKRVCSALMASAVIATSVSANVAPVKAANIMADTQLSTSPIGLSDVQNGVFLQCWNWSFNTIADNMEKIASLGYTAVQTSPIQQSAKITKGGKASATWWWLYQPINFSIDDSGNSALGTKAEFEAMCAKAHEYGIKVIVDIVPNHLASGNSCQPNSICMPELKDDSECWHSAKLKITNNNDRMQLTQYCSGGLPDLNTGSVKVQSYVIGFMKECIDSGADGFRFDSAKHIETEKDDITYKSDFWKNVITESTEYAKSTRDIDLYCYGEVLGNPYTDMTGYTDYISITDTGYSDSTTNFLYKGEAAMIEYSGYNYPEDRQNGRYPVVWAESHDTWANTDGATRDLDEKWVKLAWAFTAARANGTPLYFARTAATKLTAATLLMGEAPETGWCSDEVAVVNKFHNYFAGDNEVDAVTSNYSNILVVERKTGDKYGVAVVNCAGTSETISQPVSLIPNGTYTDDVTGKEFKVTDGKLTGTLGENGYSMVYLTKAEEVCKIDSFKASASGKSVKLTAKATGNNLKYKFYVKSGSKNTVISNYSTKSTATWTPKKAGSYTLYVDVTNGSSTVTKKCSYTIKALSVSSFKPSASKIKVKKKVTLTAKSAGGIGTSKFQFTYTLNGKKTTIKKYSTSKTASFTPKKKGTYKVTLSVKDEAGTVKTKTVSVKVS